VSVVIVGVIRRKPVLTHASIVCEGMLASVNSVSNDENDCMPGMGHAVHVGNPTCRHNNNVLHVRKLVTPSAG